MNILRSLLGFMMIGLSNPPTPDPLACRMCRHTEKDSLGGCAHCGVYCCSVCQKYHFGIASQPCNGQGVELPP